jgi:recombinational DNA repair protein (RecF pathway)
LINKATEDKPEAEYFHLMQTALESLDDAAVDLDLINIWLAAQLLRLAGHTPNLRTQSDGQKLQASQTYDFNFDKMCFEPGQAFGADQIKFLRFMFGSNSPKTLGKIEKASYLSESVQPLLRLALQNHVRQ